MVKRVKCSVEKQPTKETSQTEWNNTTNIRCEHLFCLDQQAVGVVILVRLRRMCHYHLPQCPWSICGKGSQSVWWRSSGRVLIRSAIRRVCAIWYSGLFLVQLVYVQCCCVGSGSTMNCRGVRARFELFVECLVERWTVGQGYGWV